MLLFWGKRAGFLGEKGGSASYSEIERGTGFPRRGGGVGLRLAGEGVCRQGEHIFPGPELLRFDLRKSRHSAFRGGFWQNGFFADLYFWAA